MSKYKPNSPKEFMDHKNVEKFAKQNHLDIRNGKGDHAVIKYGSDEMVYCRRNMGYGLACTIYKWFKLIGLLCFMVCVFLLVIRITYYI